LEFSSGGGEKICHSEMELDLREKDLEQAEERAEALVGDAWVETVLGQDRAATAFAPPVERSWRMNGASHAITWYVPNAAPI